jgi:hypothetical protein
MSTRKKILLYAGLACTALVLAPATAAAAATGPPAARIAGPPGYVTVTSPTKNLPPAATVSATATCPKSTVVLSGGAFIASTKLTTAINASAPVGTTAWRAFVNNLSKTTATTFNVYAVCATRPAGYAIPSGSLVGVDAGTQVLAGAVCPSSSDDVTGGGVIDSPGVTTDLASSYPVASDEWAAAVSNNSKTGSETVRAVAVCAAASALPGYTQQPTTAPNPANTQTTITESCIAPAVAVGGGNQTSATLNTDIWMKATRPIGAAWRGGENNASGLNANLTVYAICAT